MPDEDATIAAFRDASARLLALPLDASWQAGVSSNLKVCFELARLVESVPLPDDAEPAPVFEA